MDELTRRRMLWIALVVSAGFFLITLLLAATGTLTSGWYLIGAAVYGAVFVLAIIGFLTEAAPPPSSVAMFQAPAASLPEPPQGRRERLEERVLYTTPRGQVVEVSRSSNGVVEHDYTVETEGRVTPIREVEAAVEEREVEPGEPPTDPQLRAALQRWGRIREVS